MYLAGYKLSRALGTNVRTPRRKWSAILAASDILLGEALASSGQDREASKEFHQALIIVKPLNSAKPGDLDALYVAADAYSELGNLSAKAARALPLEQRKSYWREAHSWYAQSMKIWHRIERPNHPTPNGFHVGDAALVAKRLKLRSRLKQLQSNSLYYLIRKLCLTVTFQNKHLRRVNADIKTATIHAATRNELVLVESNALSSKAGRMPSHFCESGLSYLFLSCLARKQL